MTCAPSGMESNWNFDREELWWQVTELVENLRALEWRVTFYFWKQFKLFVPLLLSFFFFLNNLRSIKQVAVHTPHKPSVLVNIYTLCQVRGYNPAVSFGHAVCDLSQLLLDYRLKLIGSLNSWAAPRIARCTRHLSQRRGRTGILWYPRAERPTSTPRPLATSPTVSLSRKPGFRSAVAIEVKGQEIG